MNEDSRPDGREADGNGYVRTSIESLLGHQSDTGAFVASPDFAQYGYCWLRDASFSAYALDRVGEHDAAWRYHAWVDRTIGASGIGALIESAIGKRLGGVSLEPGDMPPARFSLTGALVEDDWPNFQIDGYGTWLWALSEHMALSGRATLPTELEDTVDRTARYLSTFAFEPCYDVWEENGDDVHTSTLASVFAGLLAAAALLEDRGFEGRAAVVRDHLERLGSRVGRYQKSSAQSAVDASLLWLGSPFGVAAIDDPLLLVTVEQIERDLVHAGGVRRYAADTYFGGGAWPVLTCSLGWHYARVGRPDDAHRCLDWTRAHLDSEGRLAEQFGGEDRDPEHYEAWLGRWGPPARDLLWSHAMHVVLSIELATASSREHSDKHATTIDERS
jgi:GH15 family glucan-1,4-alpha-glucosidase